MGDEENQQDWLAYGKRIGANEADAFVVGLAMLTASFKHFAKDRDLILWFADIITEGLHKAGAPITANVDGTG